MAGDLYFMIEGGKALDLVKAHIAKVKDTDAFNRAVCEELGVRRFWPSVSNGVVRGVVFEGAVHPEFKKPNRQGGSTPKKGTEWDRRFQAHEGFDKFGYTIAESMGVPTDINYTFEGGHGGGAVGSGFRAGGFLFLSEDGPYACWFPDVVAAVREHEARGHTVKEPAKSWKPEIDGARPILKEEWELLVAEHKLSEARAA